MDGRHTGASVRSAVWLQRRAGLPETGCLDRATWDQLARLYDLFLARWGPRCLPESPAGRGAAPALSAFPWEPRDRRR